MENGGLGEGREDGMMDEEKRTGGGGGHDGEEGNNGLDTMNE